MASTVAGEHAGDEAPPAGVGGADHAVRRLDERHRRAVSHPDAEQRAPGTAVTERVGRRRRRARRRRRPPTTVAPCTWSSHVQGRSTHGAPARGEQPSAGARSALRSPSARVVNRTRGRRRPHGDVERRPVPAPARPCTAAYFRNDGTSKSSSPPSSRGPRRRRRRTGRSTGLGERRPRTRSARLGRLAVAVPPVEAGGDDGDPDLVAHLVVDDRAEDDVGVRVGDAVDDLGGRVDLEQAEVADRPVMLSRMPRAPSMAASSSGLEIAAWAAATRTARRRSPGRCP